MAANFLNAQHLKKDGSPDMRYKENRITLVHPFSNLTYMAPVYPEMHLKKDGTPDMRFKENKAKFPTPPSEVNYKSTNTSVPKFSKINYSYSIKRDQKGTIKRSQAARYQFKKQTGFLNGRPGYVIDHIIPLKKGGCDCPNNMQWQTIREAKAKDKVE